MQNYQLPTQNDEQKSLIQPAQLGKRKAEDFDLNDNC